MFSIERGDANLYNVCRDLEHFHSIMVVKYLQGFSKTLWIGIENVNNFYICRLPSKRFDVKSQYKIMFISHFMKFVFKSIGTLSNFQWNIRYFSFLGTVCYYPQTGWNQIILLMVLLNKMRMRVENNVLYFYFWY